MFNKEYVLKNLYQIVCLEITDQKKRIKFGLYYFTSGYFEDLHQVISASRELERLKDFYVGEYYKREEENNK